MALTKEAALALRPKIEETDEVPGLGDTVFIRELSISERNRWGSWLAAFAFQTAEDADMGALTHGYAQRAHWLVATATVDAEGAQLFESVEAADFLPAEAVEFLQDRIERYNGLSAEGREEIAGN